MLAQNALFGLLAALLLTLFTACSSAPKKPESLVRIGMDKATVIEVLGPPKRTARVHSSDRWTYETVGDEQTVATDIYFQSGRVSYIGTPDAKDLKKIKPDSGFKDVTGAE